MNSISSEIKKIVLSLETEPVNPKEINPDVLKKMKLDIQIKESSDEQVRMMLAGYLLKQAGLTEYLDKLFKNGKRGWEKAWEQVKDKALQAQIKALKTVNDIGAFIKDHPSLVWAVLGALLLGYLTLPPGAMAEVLKPETVKDLAKNLDLSFSPGYSTGNINLTGEWVNELVKRSLANTGSMTQAITDLYQNIGNVLQEKMLQLGIPADTIHSEAFKSKWVELYKYIAQYANKVLLK
jgi:hypothetical protein